MSTRLFDLFIDRVVRDKDARVVERGAKVQYVGDESWKVTYLLFADDAALEADPIMFGCKA